MDAIDEKLLSALRDNAFGAGEVVSDHERRLRDQVPPSAPIAERR